MDFNSYFLIFDKYSNLIKWMYILILKKDDSRRSELEKQFLRKINSLLVYHFESRYITLVPNDVLEFIKKNNFEIIEGKVFSLGDSNNKETKYINIFARKK